MAHPKKKRIYGVYAEQDQVRVGIFEDFIIDLKEIFK